MSDVNHTKSHASCPGRVVVRDNGKRRALCRVLDIGTMVDPSFFKIGSLLAFRTSEFFFPFFFPTGLVQL